jgi:mRNA-degrading endonuclease toxin of MazEF toxin-antitoxin module
MSSRGPRPAAPGTYVRLAKGVGGLPADSILLLDQARSLDAVRVRRFLGTLDKRTLDAVLATWIAMFRR